MSATSRSGIRAKAVRATYEEVPGGSLPEKVDLTIIKRAAHAACSLDGVCDWDIDDHQFGHRDDQRPADGRRHLPDRRADFVDFGPSPPWSCGPDGPGQFRCDIAGIVLVPGASTRSQRAGRRFPPTIPADKITNCAKVRARSRTRAISPTTRPAPTSACRTSNPGQPALRITKTCDAAVAGAAVSCRITVISLGTAAPSGPVRVNDAATILGAATPVQIQTVTPDGPEWSCGAGSCRHAVVPDPRRRH